MSKLLQKTISLFVALTLVFHILPLNSFASTAESTEGSTQAQIQNYSEISTEDNEFDEGLMADISILYENEEKRGEFYKDFTLSNGLSLAAVYPYSVHYEKDGQWKEIDHTLIAATEQGNAVYKNKEGAWNVYFPQTLTSNNSVSISKDSYTLSFGMAGELRLGDVPIAPGGAVVASAIGSITNENYAITAAQNSVAQIQESNIQSVKETAQHPETICEKNTARLLYANVYSNTSIIYDLLGNEIKESIVIRSFDEELRGYRYTLNTGAMIPVVQEDGSIILYAPDKQTVVFTMPAPYMVDCNGEYSSDVDITLSGSNGAYTLTYVLPTAWLAEEDRAWPVILDPIVNAVSSVSNIADRTVAEERTLAPDWGMNACGYRDGWGIHRFYMKFITLPALEIADIIVHADVSIYDQYDPDTFSIVEVHEVFSTWTSTGMTWANAPTFSDAVTDFIHVTAAGEYTFDITELACKWYSGLNTGMVFKMSDEVEQSAVEDWKQFYSCEFGVVRPTLRIFYRNSNGLEDYWDYTASSAGRAGTGYVNNVTGNLTWIHNDIGFGGNRMPVSISHIYNANDSASNAFGMGYGWRTNFNQTVTKTSNTNAPYVWEDGDGTKHYFVSNGSGSYMDEDGLQLTLTVNNADAKNYTIADRYGNTSVFQNTRLKYIYNNQNPADGRSGISIEHNSGGQITCVKDGINRAYNFTYSDGLLTRISYTGTGSTEISFVSFGYNGQKLISITHKDSKSVSFAYNEGILIDGNHENANYLSTFNFLTSATDIDGYKIQYIYMVGNSPKVLQIEERDIPQNSTVYQTGSTLTFAYGYNQTKITDHNDNYQLHQFNDWGNLVSVQDSMGRAQLAKYALTDYEEKTSATTTKANQLDEASKMLSTVANLLPNSSFEGLGIWSGGSAASISYIGTGSMQVSDSSSATYSSTGFTVEAGQTITFSAYVKTSSTNNVKLTLVSGSNTLATGEEITSSSEFTRIQLSYTNTGSTSVTVVPQIVNGSGGVAYVDCVQLEYMPTASRYNLVKNGMITSLASWTRYNCTGNDGYINISSLNDESGQPRKTAMPILGEGVYRIVGNPLGQKFIAQTINISGAEGDAYILSGWAMADAVPLSGDREFGLKLVFKKEGSVVGEFYEEFNTAISGGDWQFTACYANAPAAYDSITVEVLYNYAANTAYFDGIQLLKERFGSTYTYEDGNVKTAMDEEGNVTQYTYADNNLTTVVQPDGKTTTYTYDNYHNVLTATTPEGVVYTYTYDKYGNNTSVSIGSGTTKIISIATYSTDGNILVSTRDSLDKLTTYGYNVDTNVLEWVKYPNDTESTRTEYTYDSVFRLAAAVKDVSSEYALSANYEYSDDFLTKIQTKSTKYFFTYGAFGLRESIKVGSRTLATYTYTAQDHDVSVLTYGNGDSVTYTYDDYGRVILETYEDGSTIAYAYDNDGALATITDSESGIKTTYYYDFSSRLMKYVESGSSYSHSVGYEFDNTTSNISKLIETINGVQYTSTYTYDGDNRIQTLNTSVNGTHRCAIGYVYDAYGRTDTITAQLVSGRTVSRYYTYAFSTSGKASNQVKHYQISSPSLNITYSYAYDGNGNILAILENSSLVISYEYDSANQLIRENNAYAQKTWVWTYDDAGNILSRAEYAYTTGALGTATEVEYEYKDYEETDEPWGDLLTKYGGQTIRYDGIGNPVSDGTWSYTWKQGRQLATMSNGSTTWTYTYDANGMRTKRSNGSLTYSYVYNGSQLSQLTVANATLKFIYDASGTPVAVVFNGVPYYYVTNLQGDVEFILNVSGQVMVAYVYDAWGNVISTSGSLVNTLGRWNPLRYRGYVYDEETGLYYVSSRYYDPEIGRWISPEPNVDYGEFDEGAGLLGYNVYAYCANNPVMFKDETGESITLACVLIGAGIGLIVGAVGGSHYAKHKKNLTPSDGWDYWKYVVGFGVAGGAVGALVGWGAGALIAKYGVATAATSITKGGGARFSSFNALKRSLGSAGKGKQWHHIVEQCQIGKSGFSKYWIQNSNNVINISNSVHAKISAYYSSIQSFTNGMTFRNWLAGQSFKTQYEWGIKVLRMFGVKI